MANLFVELGRGFKALGDYLTGRRSVTQIKKDLASHAEKIAQDTGYIEEDEELDDDAVFDYTKFGHTVGNMELWGGYNLNDYSEDFAKVYVTVGTYGLGTALADIGLSSDVLGSSGSSEEVAEEVLTEETVEKKNWLPLFSIAFLLLFIL